MISLTEESPSLDVKSLKDHREELAHKIFKGEEVINLLDVEIDNLGFQLMALRQPMAIDLRLISSVIRITVELERIADIGILSGFPVCSVRLKSGSCRKDKES